MVQVKEQDKRHERKAGEDLLPQMASG